jgi:hypothetical protein
VLAKQITHVSLCVTLHGWQGEHCPAQVQAWAFKMKITLAISNYMGM